MRYFSTILFLPAVRRQETKKTNFYLLIGLCIATIMAVAFVPKPFLQSANIFVIDTDGDGVDDATDNCPSTANSGQEDADGDGVGDICDNCMNSANAGQGDADGDGVGDICDNCIVNANPFQEDFDSDGKGNVCDNCINNNNSFQEDFDSDGKGDVCDNCINNANAGQEDNDIDGIGNVCDNCINSTNAGQEDTDADGIGNACDNCMNNANAGQEDADADGKGNVCDNCINNANVGQEDNDADGIGNVCDICPNVAGVICPVIKLLGDINDITNGATIATITNKTYVGNVETGSKIVDYTIENIGATDLTLTGTAPNYVTLTGSTDFIILTQPSSATIAPNSSVTFSVQFTPSGAIGFKNATVNIANDDPNKNPYTFAIQGRKVTVDSKRGNMLALNGTNQYVATNQVTEITTDQFTMEAWVNFTTIQTGNRTILYNGNNTANGYGLYLINGTVQILVAGVATHNTGFIPTANTWTHFALTYRDDDLTFRFYVNGVQTSTFLSSYNTPSTNLKIGGNTDLNECLHAKIEEVKIWGVSLDESEIRERMYLTALGTETGLVNYFQFNESSGNVIDNFSNITATLAGSESRTTSTASVGKGVSKLVTLGATGTAGIEVTLATTNMQINFTNAGVAPNGQIGIYQITAETPYQNTNLSPATTSCYWIVQNFGATNAGLAIDNILMRIPNSNIISNNDETNTNNIKLYKRTINGGNTWVNVSGLGATFASNTTKQITFNGANVTSFSEFIIGSGTSPLPITLLELKGERVEGLNGDLTEEVRLEWSTASEINNKGFEIQVSDNAQTYKTIAFVEGKGNSVKVMSYELVVSNPNDSYYRLKQVDFDGTFSYSPIVFVEGINALKVYPNPNSGTFTISVGKEKLDSPARLLNAQGSEVWQGIATKVATTALPAGMYFLHTTVAGKVKVTKVVVQR